MRVQVSQAVAVAATLLASCTGHWPAPPSAALTVPEGIEVGWDPYQGGDPDHYNLLYPLSVSVTDGEGGYALNSIEVDFFSVSSGIYLLPESVIRIAVPEGEDGSDLRDDPDSGWYDADPEDGYPYAEFIGEFEDDYHPTYYQGVTDSSGVARVWLWIEDMPVSQDDEGEYIVGDTSVLIDIGVEQGEFLIVAAG